MKLYSHHFQKVMKINFYLFLILIIAVINISAQERYTKGAENGYAWRWMENPYVLFDDSKEIYLSSALERYSLLKQRFPQIENLGCRDEVNFLLQLDKSNEISLDDMVTAIDNFYRSSINMKIPIIFAYCYCIKEKANISSKQLSDYKKELLKFSEE